MGLRVCVSMFKVGTVTGIHGFVLVLPYKGKRMGTAAGWVPDFLCLSSEYWCVLVLLPLLIFVG